MLTVMDSSVKDGEGGGEEKVEDINGREGKVGPTMSGGDGAHSLVDWLMVKSLARGFSEDLLEGLSSLTDISSNWSLQTKN